MYYLLLWPSPAPHALIAEWILLLSLLFDLSSLEGLLGSLERLQLDYVDIVLTSHDPERVCTIEEIARARTFAVQQGWTFYWGTSNWSTDDIMVCHFKYLALFPSHQIVVRCSHWLKQTSPLEYLRSVD